MSFETYFLLTSFAFASTGFIALALSGRLDAPATMLYASALLGSWLLERRHPDRLLELNPARLISLAYIPVCAIDAMFLSPPFLVLTHFVLYMSVVKLFQKKQDSDWVWIYALTFFEMLLTAALTVSLSFVASLLLFLFTFVTTLGAFEIRRSHRGARGVGEAERPPIDGGRQPRRVAHLAGVGAVQLALVALLAAPIFLLMPRFSGGAFARNFGAPQSLTGFSETVELGDVTNIKQSDALVMHVTLDREPGRWVRWRGVALDTFDGNKWTAARQSPSAPSTDDRRVMLYPVGYPAGREPDLLGQSIILEGIDSDVLFAARRPVAVEGAFSSLRTDAAGNLRGPSHSGQRLTYTVYSDAAVPSEAELERDVSTDYPATIAGLDLGLPDGDPTAARRIADLASDVVGDATTPYRKAQRIEAFLKSKFSYSLSPRRVDYSLDQVSDFLLASHEGHCELFATGMVLLLRSQGIPSRIVNGFQMGELNGISNTYRVRERDAHSWVEVYFNGRKGWVEFDPTPSAGINSYSNDGFAARLKQAAEAIQITWIRYVVGLDDREQVSMLRGLQARFVATKDGIARTIARWRAWAVARVSRIGTATPMGRSAIGVAIALVTLIGLGSLALFALHGRGWALGGFVLPVWRIGALFRRRRREPARDAVLFYGQMLQMLAHHGLSRAPEETPREFAARCEIDEVAVVTELYHHARFGDAGESLATDARRALSGLATRLQSRPRLSGSKASRGVPKPKRE